MMQNPTTTNQFYNSMLNEPLPPTPHFARQSPPHQQSQTPHSPLRLPSNREHQPTSSSFAYQHQLQQEEQQQSVVGPSDTYGVHHQQFNGSTATNGRNHNNIHDIRSAKPVIEETKVCVIVDSRTPVIIKIPIAPSRITLADLKRALSAIDQPNYKYFFKSNDSEFGIVKEEIQEDDCQLPTYRNRVVAWIVTPGHLGDELASKIKSETSDTCNLTYTNTSYDDGSSSMLTTDLESTSYFTETDDESVSCSNYSATTCDTFISQRRNYRYRTNGNSPINSHHNNSKNLPYKNNGHHDRLGNLDNISSSSSSSSSSTASSASYSDRTAVHCVTVPLVLTNENFLGLHIYANAVNGIDEGIYVDGVAENSAVALDGRIEPGDKLIQVNEVNLEELTNEEAVKVLKDAVIKRGPLKLVVAKFIETNKNDPIAGLKEPVHPIDTAAWVAHAQAVTIPNHEHANSATSSPSFGSNAHDTDCIRPASTGVGRLGSGLRLNHVTTDLKDIVHHMKMPEHGLEIKDREWLKIHIPKAFLGSDLLTWLERNVYGFTNEREAKKFASMMLKEGYIRDPISKKSFSSKSYYTFVN